MDGRNRVLESRGHLATALREQPRRVIAALADGEPLEATPILRDDERLEGAEYRTLVYELHHVHLPELAAAGIVEFDRSADELRRGVRFDAVRPDGGSRPERSP